MAAKVAITVKSVLNHVTPCTTPGVVTAQCRKCHSEITRRENAELLSKSSARSAVVGHTYDGRDLVGDASKCSQGCGQAVPST
jgi:hypothetical protein